MVLAWSTNCYHSPDLALPLPCETFTNLYHRGEGQGIDLSMGGGGSLAWQSGRGYTGLERWYSVAQRGEPYTHSDGVTRWWVGVGNEKEKNLTMVA